jgi:hypothetical protein
MVNDPGCFHIVQFSFNCLFQRRLVLSLSLLVSFQIRDYGYGMDYLLHIENLEILVGPSKNILELCQEFHELSDLIRGTL